MAHDDHIPPAWDYNPATWPQRLPIIFLALVGFAIATYLALFQYDVVTTVWEPFFGEGSRTILKSNLSYPFKHAGIPMPFPITDAALGAFGYLLDAVTGAIGRTKRWRTMPWIVILFAILVGPLGAISIGLVIAQPVIYDSWCTLCLMTAVISMLMVGPAMDEALASLQYMRRAIDDPDISAWRAFWGLKQKTPNVATEGA